MQCKVLCTIIIQYTYVIRLTLRLLIALIMPCDFHGLVRPKRMRLYNALVVATFANVLSSCGSRGGKPRIFQQVYLSCIWAYGRGTLNGTKLAWIWVQSPRPMGLRRRVKPGLSGLKLVPLAAMVVSQRRTDWPVNKDCKKSCKIFDL